MIKLYSVFCVPADFSALRLKIRVRNMKKYEHVPLKLLEGTFLSWKELLSAGDLGHIFMPPFGDGVYRLHQFRDWLFKKHQVTLKIIDLEMEMIEEVDLINKLIVETDSHIALITRNYFFSPDKLAEVNALEMAHLGSQHGLLILHEGFPSLWFENGQKLPTTLLQHRLTLPLYQSEVVLGFIDLMAKEWKMKIDSNIRQQCYEYCGGYLFLVKHVLRQIRQDKDKSFQDCISDESFQWRVKQIWEELPDAHQRVLIEKTRLNTDSSKSEELAEFGFYNQKGELFPFLSDWIEVMINKSLILTRQKIIFKGIDITNNFSRRERRVLELLVDNKDKCVTRDQLGEIYWQEEWKEKYSDWAIDKVISRLRQKIEQEMMPLQILTLRGRGYVYRS